MLKRMKDARCEAFAWYMIEYGATVRETARVFRTSKSTVHSYVTKRLWKVNSAMAAEVRKVLDKNKAERHLRGGAVTKKKYKLLRREKMSSKN